MHRREKILYKSNYSGTMTRLIHSRSHMECPGRSFVVIAESRLPNHHITRNRKFVCPRNVSADARENATVKGSMKTQSTGKHAPTAGRTGKKIILTISGNIAGKMKPPANVTGRNSGREIASAGCR